MQEEWSHNQQIQETQQTSIFLSSHFSSHAEIRMTWEMNPCVTRWDMKIGYFNVHQTRVSQGQGCVCPLSPANPCVQPGAWHEAGTQQREGPCRRDKFRGRQKRPVTFHLCNQVRVPDDGADEEPVVRHFCTFLHLGSTQVKVHLVVGTGHSGQIEIAHPAELQLEGQGGFQVTVNAIFCKLQANRKEKTDTQTHTKLDT